MRTVLTIAATAVALSHACAHASPPASVHPTTPVQVAPNAARDALFVGLWAFQVQVAGRVFHGTMNVSRDLAGWHCEIKGDDGTSPVVRSVTVNADTLTASVTVPEDTPVSVMAMLQPDGSLIGKIFVAGGEGAFSAKKE